MTKQYDWFWYELMTGDPEAAARFYGDVVGWKVSSYSMGEQAPAYWLGNVTNRGVVGFLARPAEVPASVKPFWSGYLYTDDADATAKMIRDAGGSVLRDAWDIPGVGRIAVLADPEGGVFNVMKPRSENAPPPLEPWSPGSVGWCELHSSDPEKNFAWYEELFGWRRSDAMDMGAAGIYQMFSTNEQPMSGGSCGKMGGEQPTHWLYYFVVDGLDAAIDRAKQGGGSMSTEPHEVPGGTWIAIGSDPQGAVFALHSQKR